jgi:hypothetical protein
LSPGSLRAVQVGIGMSVSRLPALRLAKVAMHGQSKNKKRNTTDLPSR